MRTIKNRGWKWDVDIYDRPGWSNTHWGGGSIQIRKNDEIVIRFDSADEKGIFDDFYIEHYRRVFLSSKDGGLTWKEIEPYPEFGKLVLSDGTFLEVVNERSLQSREEQRARLKKLGIGHIWRDDCLLGWELWPESMAEELRKKGLFVWDKKVGPTSDYIYLPHGVVATYTPGFIVRRSVDGGHAWTEGKIPCLEESSFSHLVCGGEGIVLPDDTILIPFYGVEKDTHKKESKLFAEKCSLFVLRSEDKGETWRMVEVDLAEGQFVSETSLVYHPSGRVIALIRSESERHSIYESHSDNGGKNWSALRRTGMQGSPLHAICLESGNILCAYAHRNYPAGIRATLSYNKGETWDVANERILRDDCLPTCCIGGPGSVQLDDGTIFTFYNLVKVATTKKEDRLKADRQLVLNPKFHCYIAGSRYTEDYTGPLGKQ